MQSNGTSSLQQKSEFSCQLQATDIIQPKKNSKRQPKEVQGGTRPNLPVRDREEQMPLCMGLQEPTQSHMGQETKHRGCVGNGDCEKERNRRVMEDVLNLAKQSLMDNVQTLNKHTVK